MGAWATAITQGLGRAGNEYAQAKDLKLDEAQKRLQMLQAQLGLTELQQRIKQSAAPQFIGQHTDPTGHITNTTRDPFTGKLSTEAGGTEYVKPLGVYKPLLTEAGDYLLYNDVTGERKPFLDPDTGKPVRGFPKGKNGPLIVDDKPIGVIRGGRPLTPDDPEFTPSDALLLASSLKGYEESEKRKDERIKLAANSRVEAYMRTREYGALDAQTGALVYATPDEMRNNPGRYAPPGPAVQAKNRQAIFQEIDTTKGFLTDAIAKLPDSAFDPSARLQLSYVLRDEAPRAAFYNFLTSDVAATLTPEQIDYVTSLVSMDESAMSLRSLAGMGAGSDMLRGAILKMLPGASTPSKAYALRQLNIFNGELQALRTSVPNIGEPGQGGGATAPHTTTKGKGTQDDPIVVP